jgi:ABC-type dipeptide/oligopeptide/nickel transport system permease component
MGASLAAILTRMVRTAMLEELGQDYIRTARAKGLTELAVVCRHALPNALVPDHHRCRVAIRRSAWPEPS